MTSYLLMAGSLCFFMYISITSFENQEIGYPRDGYDFENVAFLVTSVTSIGLSVIVLKTSSMLHKVFPVMFGLLVAYCIVIIMATIVLFVTNNFTQYLKYTIAQVFTTVLVTNFTTMSALFVEFMADFMYPVREQTIYSICISTLFLPYIGRHCLLVYLGRDYSQIFLIQTFQN